MVELIPERYVAPLDPEAIFGRVAPLHVDLGCGDGSFLCDLAQRHPDQNFLGIERLVGRVAKVSRKAAALHNVRVLNVEGSYAVRYLLPEQSIANFYLFFPDPWPKRRHHRRRIITKEFLDSLYRALETNGMLHIATDDLDYFRQIERLVFLTLERINSHFDSCKQSSLSKFEIAKLAGPELPATKFERRFRQAGMPIYRLTLRKISPVR